MRYLRSSIRIRSLAKRTLALCLLGSVSLDSQAAIPEYEFVDLTYNGQELIPHGISNDGTIVGEWRGQGWQSGFLLRDGFLTSVAIPFGYPTAILGISPSGNTCVGTYYDDIDRAHSFVYQGDGTIRYLPDLGGALYSTFATDIDDNGVIVGSLSVETGHPSSPGVPFFIGEGFVLDGEKVRTMSVPGSAFTFIGGSNDAGKLVGYWRDAPPSQDAHLFLVAGGTHTDLPIPTSNWPQYIDINNHDQIVGSGYQQGSRSVGFLLDGEKCILIRHPKGTNTYLHGIDDHGRIVGIRRDIDDDNWRGFIAYPKHAIPEASSLALLLAGAPLVMMRRRKR